MKQEIREIEKSNVVKTRRKKEGEGNLHLGRKRVKLELVNCRIYFKLKFISDHASFPLLSE